MEESQIFRLLAELDEIADVLGNIPLWRLRVLAKAGQFQTLIGECERVKALCDQESKEQRQEKTGERGEQVK